MFNIRYLNSIVGI